MRQSGKRGGKGEERGRVTQTGQGHTMIYLPFFIPSSLSFSSQVLFFIYSRKNTPPTFFFSFGRSSISRKLF